MRYFNGNGQAAKWPKRFFGAASWLIIFCAGIVWAQTTAFTYQGKLTDAGNAANGVYDLQFRLFDSLASGNPSSSLIVHEDVAVSNGLFTVTLDFGASAFSGANLWLEISVRPGVSTGAFTTLNPRQPINSAPYALRSLNATAADGLSVACVNCVTSSQIGSLPANSGNYIQNTDTQQASSNFNISGNGTAGGTLTGNLVNATTQYNLADNRILSNPGSNNLFVGVQAGAVNSFGSDNAFFGSRAGFANKTGNLNAFFGYSAGSANIAGSRNAFFGYSAGFANTGYNNAFFGYQAGISNTEGSDNAFFGSRAGFVNTTGSYNAFFGNDAGDTNTTGLRNAFFGSDAGSSNTTGWWNAFFGDNAGGTNTTGHNNSFFGHGADAAAGDLSYATAIGAFARVSQSNSIVLGREMNQTSADRVGIGIPNPARTLDVSGRARIRNMPLEANTAHVCMNALGDLLNCGGSSLRWKKNIQPYRHGLDVLLRLRPISFNWKEGGQHDFGLGAEDVAQVEPTLTVTDDQGIISGVKYEKLNILLINAVKEQQAQLNRQQQQIDALKKLVCQTNPRVTACQE